MVIPLLSPPPCTITVLSHCQTLRFHLLCCGNSLYSLLSGVRKGMAVSTVTAVKAGLLFSFFLDQRQPGTQGDATPIKVYFNRFPRVILNAKGSKHWREYTWTSHLDYFFQTYTVKWDYNKILVRVTVRAIKDGKRCVDSLRTAFIRCKWNSVVSLTNLPRFKRASVLVFLHMTQAARSQPVYSFGFQRSWCAKH